MVHVGYHGEAHIRFLQSWTIIGSISCYCDNLPLFHNAAVDDTWTQTDKEKAIKCE